MIIGQIVDVSHDGAAFSGNGGTGAMLHFYTYNDAVTWAQMASEQMDFNQFGDLYVATVIIDTDNGVRRYWFDGVEYTG